MSIYLPVAELSVNLYAIIFLGLGVGILSGMFGIGGGFIMTPVLIFMGIPPSVSVATLPSQVLATSMSGALVHFQRKTIDYKMGFILLLGGILGSTIGIRIFEYLREAGQVEVFISLAYVALLGFVGSLMIGETFVSMVRTRKAVIPERGGNNFTNWPLQMSFRFRKEPLSIIPPFLIGLLVGVLSAILGIGGGFLIIPAMIYILQMPTKSVIGTSMFQIVFLTAYTTMMHALITGTLDILLAVLLIIGSVPGARIGALIALRMQPVVLRLGLGLVIFIIMIVLLLSLIVEPNEFYQVLR